MLKDDELIGAIIIYRQEVRPFTDKQIALVQNFAAQAVIAIENTRLLNELRARDLAGATDGDIGGAAASSSSSPGELEPVFQAMLENATRICEANFGMLFRYEMKRYAACGISACRRRYAEYAGATRPIRPIPHPLGRVAATKQVCRLPIRAEQAHAEATPRAWRPSLAARGSYLGVPMIKEDKLVGAITIFRQEVRPFTDKQIEFVKLRRPGRHRHREHAAAQ